MKRLIIALSTFIGVTGTALSADMPVKAPPPVVVPVYSWTGCYIGGHIGGLWVRKDWTLVTGNTPLGDHNANGWFTGGQVGCNYQVDRWVFGVQGDYAWADAKGSNANLLLPAFTDFTRVRSLGSITGRVGYALDRFLPYVKGGWAWERDNYNLNGTFIIAVNTSAAETRGGWTAGVGGEYAFANNWTVFLEYDYYDFGSRTLTFVRDSGARFDDVSIKEQKSVVKGGINFKF